MRMIAALRKESAAAFTSHLDIQRLLQRAFRRAGLPLRYSSGFNPHPLLSFATALATGHTSDGEWFEAELETQPPSPRGEVGAADRGELSPEEFLARTNAQLPEGLSIWGAFAAPEGMPSLTKLLLSAKYVLRLHTDVSVTQAQAENALAKLLAQEEVLVSKKTKEGQKTVDIRPALLDVSLLHADEEGLTLSVTGALTASGGLRAELVAQALLPILGCSGWTQVHRNSLVFTAPGPWPLAPSP